MFEDDLIGKWINYKNEWKVELVVDCPKGTKAKVKKKHGGFSHVILQSKLVKIEGGIIYDFKWDHNSDGYSTWRRQG